MEHRNSAIRKAKSAPLAAIDAIEDEFGGRVAILPSDRRIVVRGWALDAGPRALAAVEVGVGGARASGPAALPRPDVAAAYGSPDTVGFRVELPLDDAAPGRHAVSLQGIRDDGSRVHIPVTVAFDVVPPVWRLPAGVTAGDVVGALDEISLESGEPCEGGALVVPRDGVVVLRGWAATPSGVPAALAYAQLDGDRFLRGMCGYARPDVAAHFGAPGASYGFRIRIPAHDLGPGEHVVRVCAVAGDVFGFVGTEAGVVVGPGAAARVFQTKPLMRGHVDVIGRMDGDTSLLEERLPLRLKANERAFITGWAGDPVARRVPNRVMLVVDGIAHGPVQRGIERPDVAAATACAALGTSGFSAVVRAEGLTPGFHRAELVALYEAEPVIFDAFSFEVVT